MDQPLQDGRCTILTLTLSCNYCSSAYQWKTNLNKHNIKTFNEKKSVKQFIGMSHLLRASLQNTWDFPGGPAVETPGFQCRGTQFLVKELRSHIQCSQKKRKNHTLKWRSSNIFAHSSPFFQRIEKLCTPSPVLKITSTVFPCKVAMVAKGVISSRLQMLMF